MDREAWGPAVHGVTKSWTRLSDWTELKKGKKKEKLRGGKKTISRDYRKKRQLYQEASVVIVVF